MSNDAITHTIVAGVDESDGAADALRWASHEADLHNATLTAVMAWGLLDQHHIVDQGFDPAYGEPQAARALREYVTRALGDQRAASITMIAVCDLPARALLDASATADLLVVGARGFGGFRGLLLGSISQHCLHHTRAPIAIIRPTDEPPKPEGRIVVGVDGSPTSQRAFRWALTEARARDASLDVVHAWQAPDAGYLPYEAGAIDTSDYEAAATRTLDKIVTTADLQDAPRIRTAPVRGGAAAAVLDAAYGADLVVVGTRGLSPLKRLVVGSVATQLAHHAPCPVVVVPPHPPDSGK